MKVLCDKCGKLVPSEQAVLATMYNAQIQTFCEDCIQDYIKKGRPKNW